jgi:hypothetical protein
MTGEQVIAAELENGRWDLAWGAPRIAIRGHLRRLILEHDEPLASRVDGFGIREIWVDPSAVATILDRSVAKTHYGRRCTCDITLRTGETHRVVGSPQMVAALLELDSDYRVGPLS